MHNPDNVLVAGIPLYNKDIPTATRKVIEECKHSRDNHCISATGAHGIVYARKNPDFNELLHSFYLNLPDGMPTVWVGRLKGALQMRRCYGPDFFAEVMRESASTDIQHFLCGGGDGIAEKLKMSCSDKFGNHNVCGTFTPPFRDINDFNYKEIGQIINESGADIVWIGLGAPKQEQFARRLAEFTDSCFIITVGAAFDFHTGGQKQAPKWMQNAGLEWFYRLMSEPKRLWRRYLEAVPLFIWYSFIDLVTYRNGRQSQTGGH